MMLLQILAIPISAASTRLSMMPVPIVNETAGYKEDQAAENNRGKMHPDFHNDLYDQQDQHHRKQRCLE